MSFHWDYTLTSESEASAEDLTAAGFGSSFPSQAEAEAWLGEVYLELLDYGVEAVTLVENENWVYGPMPLQEG